MNPVSRLVFSLLYALLRSYSVPAFWLGLLLVPMLAPSYAQGESYVPAPETVLTAIPTNVTRYWQLQQQPQTQSLPARLQQATQLLTSAQRGDNPDGYGQAEALLIPLKTPNAPLPIEAAYLLAYLKQHNHEFPAALALLEQVLIQQPRHSAALLQRAQIHLVMADYQAAQADCELLQGLISTALLRSCLAQVAAFNGHLHDANSLVLQQLAATNPLNASERYELQLSAATISEQLGEEEIATRYYLTLLVQNPNDSFVVQHLADVYLRTQHADKALVLLQNRAPEQLSLEQQVTLLQALQTSGDQDAATTLAAQLTAKFAEAQTRQVSEQPHKELALFLLLQGKGPSALQAAQRNWAVQKEPGDLLLLTEAALAADDAATVEAIQQCLKQSGLQDQRIERLLLETSL